MSSKIIDRFIKDTNNQFDLSSLPYTYVYANVSNNVSENPAIVKYNEGENLNLLYWWSGKDDLINNKWVDKIHGIKLSKTGTINKLNDEAYIISVTKSSFNYFSLPDMNNATNGLNIGSEWLIYVKFSFSTATSNLLIDFGSVCNASRAFEVAFSSSGVTGDNYKGFGNSGSEIYRAGQQTGITPQIEQIYELYYGCKKYDSTQYIQYFKINNKFYYGKNPHAKLIFNKNFNAKDMYIGKGQITTSSNWNTYPYGSNFNIYDLKIFGNA